MAPGRRLTQAKRRERRLLPQRPKHLDAIVSSSPLSLRPPGGDNRLPEEHRQKPHYNDPKNKAPFVVAIGLVDGQGRPIGIAHSETRLPPSGLTSRRIC